MTKTKNELAGEFNRKYYNTGISVYQESLRNDKYGINWSAKGTQGINETKKFIQNLKKAIIFVNKLNKLK